MSVANTLLLEFEPLNCEEIVNIINESSPFISPDVEFEDTGLFDAPDWISIN